jgi:hypothetical protein
MAETAAAEGDLSDTPETADDPIAERIDAATEVAELAPTFAVASTEAVARLTQLARIRAGAQDIIAAGPEEVDSRPTWHIQIGAVPTQEGAQALISRASGAMGAALADRQPLTQEIDHDGGKLYRARFTGFSGKDEARAACAQLQKKSFACLAVPN